MSDEYTGSNIVEVTPEITLGCISPEARELLDQLEAAWEKNYEKVKAVFPDYEPTVHGFVYWLCRYSGLVVPKATETELRARLAAQQRVVDAAIKWRSLGTISKDAKTFDEEEDAEREFFDARIELEEAVDALAALEVKP